MDTYLKRFFFNSILTISMLRRSHRWNPKSVVSNNPKCDFNVSIFCYQVFCLVKDWGNIYGCQLEGVTPLSFGFWISHIHNVQVFISIEIMEISLYLKKLQNGVIRDRICCTCSFFNSILFFTYVSTWKYMDVIDIQLYFYSD